MRKLDIFQNEVRSVQESIKQSHQNFEDKMD